SSINAPHSCALQRLKQGPTLVATRYCNIEQLVVATSYCNRTPGAGCLLQETRTPLRTRCTGKRGGRGMTSSAPNVPTPEPPSLSVNRCNEEEGRLGAWAMVVVAWEIAAAAISGPW